jgi:cytochrome c oxidase subunit 2
MVVLMTRIFTRFNVLVAVMGLSAAFGGAAIGARQQKAQVINISAERFSFTPSEFKVKAGQPVEIRLRSDDTDHGFRILDTDVNVIVPKRGKGEVTVVFEPPKPGRYVFECSKLCGAGHSFMRGSLIAE